ncbi:TIGR04283 family arsenosugar biosynthesis glycosyltransferase [Corallibacter vietnamensis]|uniref:TIGR04283 family arsenosugar biosynthesis glycosyltransferase n=1 Tax=Corallibacter vietnamensis TaxID=904130 RepID=A0ABP7GXZ8_9FLAO
MNKISIIIPVLNEASTIVSLLQYLTENSLHANIAEIIIVDGGSTDNTLNIVNHFVQNSTNDCINFHLINSLKGRAKQMNAGSLIAKGEILYFLHADSYPPKNFDKLIINTVEKGHLAGCFKLKFDSNHWWLRLAGWFTQFNWKACRGGDQSQFITKTLFKEIGGYDETFTIYEDYILINELYKRNQFIVINHNIKTSTRRYKKHGIWKLQYHFWMIYIKKWLGASPENLYKYYQKHIT